MMPAGARLQVEALVAIGAFDEMLVAHFEKDLGVAKGAAAAIAGNAGVVGFNAFGDFGRHWTLSKTGRWPGSYKLRSGSQGRIGQW